MRDIATVLALVLEALRGISFSAGFQMKLINTFAWKAATSLASSIVRGREADYESLEDLVVLSILLERTLPVDLDCTFIGAVNRYFDHISPVGREERLKTKLGTDAQKALQTYLAEELSVSIEDVQRIKLNADMVDEDALYAHRDAVVSKLRALYNAYFTRELDDHSVFSGEKQRGLEVWAVRKAHDSLKAISGKKMVMAISGRSPKGNKLPGDAVMDLLSDLALIKPLLAKVAEALARLEKEHEAKGPDHAWMIRA